MFNSDSIKNKDHIIFPTIFNFENDKWWKTGIDIVINAAMFVGVTGFAWYASIACIDIFGLNFWSVSLAVFMFIMDIVARFYDVYFSQAEETKGFEEKGAKFWGHWSVAFALVYLTSTTFMVASAIAFFNRYTTLIHDLTGTTSTAATILSAVLGVTIGLGVMIYAFHTLRRRHFSKIKATYQAQENIPKTAEKVIEIFDKEATYKRGHPPHPYTLLFQHVLSAVLAGCLGTIMAIVTHTSGLAWFFGMGELGLAAFVFYRHYYNKPAPRDSNENSAPFYCDSFWREFFYVFQGIGYGVAAFLAFHWQGYGWVASFWIGLSLCALTYASMEYNHQYPADVIRGEKRNDGKISVYVDGKEEGYTPAGLDTVVGKMACAKFIGFLALAGVGAWATYHAVYAGFAVIAQHITQMIGMSTGFYQGLAIASSIGLAIAAFFLAACAAERKWCLDRLPGVAFNPIENRLELNKDKIEARGMFFKNGNYDCGQWKDEYVNPLDSFPNLA